MYYLICMYWRLLASISPLGFYVLHYGRQYGLKWTLNGLKDKENVPNKSSGQLDLCCYALALKIYSNYVINNYLL